MTDYNAEVPEPTGHTIRIRRAKDGAWQLVVLLKITRGWVQVDSDGPLWVMRVDGKVHQDDLARLRWLELPVGE